MTNRTRQYHRCIRTVSAGGYVGAFGSTGRVGIFTTLTRNGNRGFRGAIMPLRARQRTIACDVVRTTNTVGTGRYIGAYGGTGHVGIFTNATWRRNRRFLGAIMPLGAR